ncbi:MAG: hypothetical protein DHS80DRAFT_25530 [Piptocephalis tieghemiana]|nr:MAG: hypothetical protein DHS80DRAFT_25530 [Piptocephalis tieghemiana]
MQSSTLTLLIGALMAISVSAQTPNTPTQNTTLTDFQKCVQQRQCAEADTNCRAICAGVPSPNDSQANTTNTCVAGCSTADANAFAACRDNCINSNFLANNNQAGSANGNSTSNGNSNNNGNNKGDAGASSAAIVSSSSVVLTGATLFAASLIAF